MHTESDPNSNTSFFRTDWAGGDRKGNEPLIEGLREKGITLSTVAVGRSADSLLMRALAYGGRGRFYQTDEFTDIPKIFAKEVFMAGKKYLNNRTFIPRAAGYSDILKGIDAVPQLTDMLQPPQSKRQT